MTKVLKLSAYRHLLVAYGLTQIAWAMVSLALAVLVYDRTHSAIGAAAFFLASQFVPAFFAPAVVARLDRRAPRQVLPVLFLAEAALFAVLASLVNQIGVGWILALALLDGVVALVVRSLARAATVAVVSPVGLLREGNALTNTVFTICLVVGPALGGLIVGISSVRVALIAGIALMLLIVLSLATAKQLPEALPEDSPARGRLAAALRYVRRQPVLRSVLALEAIGLVFFSMSIPVELVLAQRTLHSGAGGYGALLTTWGAGAIVGGVIFARWRRRSTWSLIALGAGALAVGFLIMGVAPTIVIAALGSAVAGAGNGVLPIAGQTALQEHAKPEWMAVVMSLNDSVWQAFPGIGILVGGAVAQINGPRMALILAGAGSAVIAAAVPLVLRPSLGGSDDGSGAPVGPLTFAAQQQSPGAER
jgi:MFS family permease